MLYLLNFKLNVSCLASASYPAHLPLLYSQTCAHNCSEPFAPQLLTLSLLQIQVDLTFNTISPWNCPFLSPCHLPYTLIPVLALLPEPLKLALCILHSYSLLHLGYTDILVKKDLIGNLSLI